MRRPVGIPAIYKGKPLPLGFHADILADEIVILEIKAVPALVPICVRGWRGGRAPRKSHTDGR